MRITELKDNSFIYYVNKDCYGIKYFNKDDKIFKKYINTGKLKESSWETIEGAYNFYNKRVKKYEEKQKEKEIAYKKYIEEQQARFEKGEMKVDELKIVDLNNAEYEEEGHYYVIVAPNGNLYPIDEDDICLKKGRFVIKNPTYNMPQLSKRIKRNLKDLANRPTIKELEC